MVECLNAVGLTAAHIDGESPDRKEILRDFAGGKFDVLCNAMLLTEGFDDPGIDCVVILRPTKSRALYSQMVGRGTRVAPAKQDLLLLDFLWLHEQHNLIRPAHLIASTQEQAAIMQQMIEGRRRQSDDDGP
jgi:superfamily II DNA or RNA helicase